jgi:hypothetical protein
VVRGDEELFSTLDAVLSRINEGGFTYEELCDMPDSVGSDFEIMLHRHEFQFLRIQLPIRRGRDPIESAQNASPAEIADLLVRELSAPLLRAGNLAVELQQ